MGNDLHKQKQKFNPQMDKQKFEISLLKVKAHLEIQRDRKQCFQILNKTFRINECNNKEKQLISMITAQTRSKVDEVHKASSIVTDINFINACNIVIRFCDILKDRSLQICQSRGSTQALNSDLLGFVESIVWASNPLNIRALQEFQGLMMMFYGVEMLNLESSAKVDPELKKCLTCLMPSPLDINEYMVKLSQKTGIPLDVINQPGHEFTDKPQPTGILVNPNLNVVQQPPQTYFTQEQLQNQQIQYDQTKYQNIGQIQIPQYPGTQVNVEIGLPQHQQQFQAQQPQQFINQPIQQQQQQFQPINQQFIPQQQQQFSNQPVQYPNMQQQQQIPQNLSYNQQIIPQQQQQQNSNLNFQYPQHFNQQQPTQQIPQIPQNNFSQQTHQQAQNFGYIPQQQSFGQQQQIPAQNFSQQIPQQNFQNQQIPQQQQLSNNSFGQQQQKQQPQFGQQQQQFQNNNQNQPQQPVQNQGQSDELDSFEARLKRLREGNN